MQRIGFFLLRLIAKTILWFIGLSLALVMLFAFVPVPITATMIMDANGATRDWEPLEEIDPNLVAAVIAAEDSKFCAHSGFDTEAIQKAYEQNQKGGRIRGGSTISQQTAKNVFLWQDGGYTRKALEAWFTFWIENIWGKRRIMEVYLNVAETGIGTYGATEGARRYFDKSAARLSRSEAARMAAALPLPKKRSVKNPSGWLARHGRTLENRLLVVQNEGLDDCVYPKD
ncbi:MAG: monofunctional biosynthetic peptidoglycan transglycosylase [Pseudomonadota bacterium]